MFRQFIKIGIVHKQNFPILQLIQKKNKTTSFDTSWLHYIGCDRAIEMGFKINLHGIPIKYRSMNIRFLLLR